MAEKFVKWNDDGRALDEAEPITSSAGATDAGNFVSVR